MIAAQKQVALIMAEPLEQNRRAVKILECLDNQQMHRWIWDPVNKADDAECLVTILVLKGDHHPSREVIHDTARLKTRYFVFQVCLRQRYKVPTVNIEVRSVAHLTKNTLDVDMFILHNGFVQIRSG